MKRKRFETSAPHPEIESRIDRLSRRYASIGLFSGSLNGRSRTLYADTGEQWLSASGLGLRTRGRLFSYEPLPSAAANANQREREDSR